MGPRPRGKGDEPGTICSHGALDHGGRRGRGFPLQLRPDGCEATMNRAPSDRAAVPDQKEGAARGSKFIPLTRGLHAIVDAADYERLASHSWYARLGGSKKTYYAARWDAGKGIHMHREILHAGPGLQVDHINGDGLDNRRANLRIVSNGQNQQNRKKHMHGTSIYKGVRLERRSMRWYASIRIGGKKSHLGSFRKEMDAAKAYDLAAERYFGAHARLNFPVSMEAAR